MFDRAKRVLAILDAEADRLFRFRWSGDKWRPAGQVPQIPLCPSSPSSKRDMVSSNNHT